MKYQVNASQDLGFGIEVLHHYEGESLDAAMEDYQMDMRQVGRGRLDRVELLADGAVIRFMNKGGEDTEVAQGVDVLFKGLGSPLQRQGSCPWRERRSSLLESQI